MDKSTPTVKENNECCSARDVLWYLVFMGFAVNYMIRTNLNIAIVSMVNERPKDNVSLTSECLNQYRQNISISISNISLSKNFDNNYYSDKNDNFTKPNKQNEKSQTFDWNEKEQSDILGAFFWLHWITQIPGGILASKYGTKLIFGLANFTGLLCCFLIPLFASFGNYYLIFLRILQGMLTGFAWPAMHNLAARWIPPNERSSFVTAYLGSSVGAALTYPLCGFIIDRWGWELVFYVCGVIGSIWYAAWLLLVFDSPAKHPRISQKEKDYILDSLGDSYTKKKAPIPWKDIVTSRPVWMNIVAQWGGIWGLFTLMTHTPTYFKFIHGWNIRATGLLSGMPHILRMLWAYMFSQLGDYLLRTNKMSRTNVRKLATSSCTIGQGICLLLLAYSGCHYNLAIVFLSAATAVSGSVSTGPLASVVDLSPNYASVILGFVNTASAIVGFITPAVVGYLTYQNQTTQQWQKVFGITAGMLFFSGFSYVAFSTSELQQWNSPVKTPNNKFPESEMMVIKRDENNSEKQEEENQLKEKN